MAFQAGSQIDPRLAALDFSGFTNAAAIQAQGMENLGKNVAKGVTGYKEQKKQDKKNQSKVNRAISYGEGMIKLLGEDHPLADVIADQMAMNFNSNIDVEQAAFAADQLTDQVTNMFLMDQKQQPISFMTSPMGTEYGVDGSGKIVVTTTAADAYGNVDLLNAITDKPVPTVLSSDEETRRLELERMAQVK